jgi:hypothetical protein
MEEQYNEHEFLRKCNLLNERHEKLKEEILERSILNEKAIIELNSIEEEYKVILDKLRLIKDMI